MATLHKMTPGVRTLEQSLFSSHSGDVYVQVLYGEDGGHEIWHIWASSPTESHFNAAPVGSFLYDIDAPATVKVHDAATTWKAKVWDE